MVGPSPGSSFAIVHATALTMAPRAARADGKATVGEDDLGILGDATIVVRDGIIADVIHGHASPAPQPGLDTYDVRGAVVMPGLVDAHTHALFAGDRVADFESLARAEKPRLGIAYTVAQTRELALPSLEVIGRRRLGPMRAHGTTTVEVKTGYALTADGEALLLEALAALDGAPDLPHVVATFCGAHALPPEFASYDAFVDELIARILPRVAATNIARFADAFCERGYFTPEQSHRFLAACAARGMQLRIHADELSASGGAKLAAALHCVSADHLNFIDADDIAALRESGTIAVLCPATAQYLELPRLAPARALIDAGVPVAFATDFNPGTCPCYSLQEVVHIARRRMRVSAPEAIAGVTTIAARSLDAFGVAGCIVPGRPADLILLETNDYREFGYYFGVNLVAWTASGKKAQHVA
ncbi:MAG: imidazolonepropionase [Candidatus Eremiobacteraeota bacterium]|nr:imidazolonepropionase [Candidatus Eremiobacteraeota bacterium]